MTREEAYRLAMRACEETWNEKTCKQIKEALEQELCNDCISRQAVKEQMIKYGFHAPDMTVTEFVEDLPPVTPQPKTRWIPVSKKLPKRNNEWYLCTVNLSNFHLVTMDLYFKNGKWLDNRRIDMFNCYEIYGYGFGKSIERHKLDYSELLEDFDWTERVVAWMPLPEPFDPQESER
jgi:hypothetical protein